MSQVLRYKPESDVVIAVDYQNPFLHSIDHGEAVLARASFLLQCANVLEIPILATEQMPQKLGYFDDRLIEFVSKPFEKSAFSSCLAAGIREELERIDRKSIILMGIETHICVTQTALDLLDAGFHVSVCPDACGARSQERHKIGMERLRDSGIMPVHTESLVYEWMRSSEHSKFREVLKLVKHFS